MLIVRFVILPHDYRWLDFTRCDLIISGPVIPRAKLRTPIWAAGKTT
jgi:hypothetical protein